MKQACTTTVTETSDVGYWYDQMFPMVASFLLLTIAMNVSSIAPHAGERLAWWAPIVTLLPAACFVLNRIFGGVKQ